MSTELAPIPKADPIAMIVAAAADSSVNAEKVRELWNLAKDMREYDAKSAFNRAMQQTQEEMRPVVRDMEVKNDSGVVTNRYARLESIDRAIRPIYIKYGFALSFGGGDANTEITCEVIHREGYSKIYPLKGVMDSTNKAKNALQAVGSTLTYLRRYLTCLIFNIQLTNDPDDDDGRGSDVISQDQLNKIRDLIMGCNMSQEAERKFCEFMGVRNIESLPSGLFVNAMTQLQAKYRGMTGKK